ncbi:hypothetical protein JOD43_001101 [Pullulanibacillus pueri]|uniref:Uncharacterized protein n=1 Tax=Pullulanibacillus pueri TaxID=1437324 RepID=A0A8J3ELK5_9BACL|nr:hypothetical protein [Pullulanibacillus pueri]MBM7680935.1 hypothetical protein [Pullulanibacillus pueri]GGH81398.1 hypothetical protein GCM10007096_19240 [Pullulanibacillus pueri]
MALQLESVKLTLEASFLPVNYMHPEGIWIHEYQQLCVSPRQEFIDFSYILRQLMFRG